MAYLKQTLFALLILAMGSPAMSQAEPLLMEGKQALYQRVLSKPGALIFTQPQEGNGAPATPFSAYYVYKRETRDGSPWVQLGLNRYGETAGWMPEIDTIPWNQGLTVAFRDPLGADRVLLFRDKEGLKSLVENGDKARYRQLYQAAEAGKLAADAPVIAIQPRTHVDILKDFYLVPIRDHEDIYLESEQARMLQVSSVPLLPLMQTKPSKPKATQPEKKTTKP
ncbi:MAG: VWA domain-containing protein, partial [Candidatus Thiodiazotropha sp. (ex Semelilucina semeliformis)]|nr:VWA domain-containing protein [Candidatus Thiodiazotropha sp. (ex Semelilucina semeliformis)]